MEESIKIQFERKIKTRGGLPVYLKQHFDINTMINIICRERELPGSPDCRQWMTRSVFDIVWSVRVLEWDNDIRPIRAQAGQSDDQWEDSAGRRIMREYLFHYADK